ncbi:HD domain-containing phosphohydrolase [Desulfofundulus sp. TPOSR]|uniref:sensor domain-containing diguanylate cyclase/phosphohydrolase n=1 Tax=Desulfofundulus sp. TPOSR TaxID=2714340 RepID=UPI001FACFF87|nr:HD domain-containing phosphohydrolase [Desulfofundulus sp. TPOSR]
MNPGALELAFLYEVSSLAWPGSEADLFDEVVEKAVRLFGVQRAALVLHDDTGQSTCHTWGFGRNKVNVLKEQPWQNRGPGRVYLKELGSPPLGNLYLERNEDFLENERRLLDVFSGRLANILQLHIWERKTRKLRERFRLVFENMPMVGALSFDREGRILHYNREVQKILGQDALLKDGDWLTRIRPAADFQKLLTRTWETGQVVEPGEWQIQTPEGDLRWALLTLVPVKQDEKVEEVFCMIIDITGRKQMEEELRRLSVFDSLTGLYNRNYFEQKIRQLDEEGVRPVSVIVCDVDGLKPVNDCLGHRQGDELLQKAAALIREVFPGEEAFRVGGDEFAVILPARDREAAQKACSILVETREKFNRGHTVIPLSISAGVGVTENPRRSVYDAYKQADDEMYRDKLQRCAAERYDVGRSLLAALFRNYPHIDKHARRVKELAWLLGKAAGLSTGEMDNLLLLAEVHDIGKVGLPDHILRKNEPLTKEEEEEMKRHCEVGYRIARCSPELTPVAELILQHHEWWDGRGYPQGLKGEEIHLLSRILAIADAYEAMTAGRPGKKVMPGEEAMTELKQRAGTRFDPHLVEIFLKLLQEENGEILPSEVFHPERAAAVTAPV